MKYTRINVEQRERPMYWKLDGHTPVPVESVLEWAEWFETADRIVAQTHVGEAFVSTVFLGLDYNGYFEGPPLLFETMVFGGQHDRYLPPLLNVGRSSRYA